MEAVVGHGKGEVLIKIHCLRCLCVSKRPIPPHRILYSSLLLHIPAIPGFSCRCRLTLHKARVLTSDLIEDLPSALSQATPRGSSNNSANNTRSSSNSASSNKLNRRASTHNIIVNNSGKNLGKIL